MKGRSLVDFLRSPLDATLEALEPIVTGEQRGRRISLLCISLLAAWYAYVPVHELLHAAGCAATGGTVTTLEIQHQYGGALLARVFPFVEPGGEYAGRLSAFDTHGSDLRYLATDALPFALSVLLGVPLLRRAAARARPGLAGPGFVLGLAPFYNLPGDYFEMGSIAATAALDSRWHGLRSDDVFALVSRLAADPAAVGLGPGDTLRAFLLIAAASALAVMFAYATWALGDRFARLTSGAPRSD